MIILIAFQLPDLITISQLSYMTMLLISLLYWFICWTCQLDDVDEFKMQMKNITYNYGQ